MSISCASSNSSTASEITFVLDHRCPAGKEASRSPVRVGEDSAHWLQHKKDLARWNALQDRKLKEVFVRNSPMEPSYVVWHIFVAGILNLANWKPQLVVSHPDDDDEEGSACLESCSTSDATTASHEFDRVQEVQGVAETERTSQRRRPLPQWLATTREGQTV